MPDTTPPTGDHPGAPLQAANEAAPQAPAEVGADGAAALAAEPAVADVPAAEVKVPETSPAAAEALAPDAAAAPAPGPRVADLSPAECAARLAALFPALFARPGAPAPLKLRIQADIQLRAPGIFNRRSLSAYLHRLTSSTAYLQALIQAPHRLDLDGEPAGEPSAEHREAATAELARRREIVAARRAAEQAARRAAQGPERSGANSAAGQGRPERGQAQGAGRPGDPARGGRAPGAEVGRDGRHGDRPAGVGDGARAGEPRRGPPSRRSGVPQPRRDAAPQPRHAVANPARQTDTPRPPSPQSGESRREAVIGDPAQQERAALLRAYETTTLTRANFIALKGLSEATLDALLTTARQEAAQRSGAGRPAGDGTAGTKLVR